MDTVTKPLFVALIVAVAGFGFVTAMVLTQDQPLEAQADEVALENTKITVTVRDSMGGVTDQKTGQNAVVNTGDNCIAKMLWHDPTTAGDQTCEGATNDPWRYFCLDQDAQVLVVDKDLRNPSASAGLSGCQKAEITWNQNSTGSTDALSKVDVQLAYTFTNTGADDEICSVGTFNGSSQATRSMMSKGNFTGGCVTVTTSSTLEVLYDFEYGGGTVP